jgi:hypothetical protein
MSPVIYRLCMIDNTPLSLQLGREINFQDFMTCLNEQNIYIIRRRYVSKFWGEAELTGIILPGKNIRNHKFSKPPFLNNKNNNTYNQLKK